MDKGYVPYLPHNRHYNTATVAVEENWSGAVMAGIPPQTGYRKCIG